MTQSLDQAAGRTWDAVVVGAGPAGALAAHELARRGVEVLLLDRAAFPRWKVCGCCLNGNALATLSAAGLGELTSCCGAVPLSEMRLASGTRQARLSLTGGVVLSREVFDAELVRAAVAGGAAFLPQTRAVLSDLRQTSRGVLLHQEQQTAEVRARVVLAADGLGGQLLARAGVSAAPAAPGAHIGAGVVAPEAPAFYRAGVIYMACGAFGYLGLVRLEDGRLDLAAALAPEAVRAAGGLGATAARLLTEMGWPSPPELVDLPWRGTPALTRTARRLAAERVFGLGDAAGYIEPFTGEGMAWALASAAAVAPLAARGSAHWRPGLMREWTACHAQLVGQRQLVSRAAATVLRYPRLARILIGVLARMPVIATPVVRYLNKG
jgi:flavin-dependent dehydrogenase